MSDTYSGGSGIPGVGNEIATVENEFLWGGAQGQLALLWKNGARYSSAARDAGASPTTVLRPGLLMGKLTSGGEYEEWDADASDGTQDIQGVLDVELRMTDYQGTAADRNARLLVRGPVKARKLFIQGLAFVGHIDEYLARKQMVDAGFVFDDDPFNYKAGRGGRMQTISAEDHTITADENGTTFFYTHTAAATSTVTLPVIKPGLEYDLVRAANSAEDFVITSADGNDMFQGNDLTGSTVTWTTTGQMIGARMKVKAVYIGTALRWLTELPDPPFGTGLTGGFAYAIA